MTFLFRENRRHGTDRRKDRQTDWVQRLMRHLETATWQRFNCLKPIYQD